ncbi:hypothetical protein ACJ41O_007092 [Fusarium nematophilum]
MWSRWPANKAGPRAPFQQANPPSCWSLALKTWWLEGLSCLFSIAAIVALVVLLQKFDDKPLPIFPLGLTLNTLIALLSTSTRACLILVIEESVSQLKWLWLRRERPLKDFEVFDEASRGPWGSLRLLARTGSWPPSLIAAVVLVSSLLTSALTQSVVTYPTRLAPVYNTNDAVAPRLDRYFSSTTYWSVDPEQKAASTDRAMWQGLNTDYKEKYQLKSPRCTTGECRWAKVNSLEICVKTWNVTDLLAVNYTTGGGKQYPLSATLPNRVYADLDTSDATRVSLFAGGESLYESREDDAPDSTAKILSFVLVYSAMVDRNDGGSGGVVGAMEMLFHFCANRYDVSISENVLSQKLIASSSDIVYKEVSYGDGTSTVNTSCVAAPEDSDEFFPIGGYKTEMLATDLGIYLNGSTADGDGGRQLDGLTPQRGKNVTTHVAFYGVVKNITENIGLSLTNSSVTIPSVHSE